MGYASLENVVTVVFLLATILQATDACVTHKYTVAIFSGLPSDSPDPLKLRCRSKNDDLGYHELSTRQNFTWSFCENVIGTTLFTCDLSWGPRYQSFQAFNSKNGGMCDGGSCIWLAWSDGIYFQRVNSPLVKEFDWLIRGT